ncbi:MAG: hypothetical protein RLZZ293_347 [Pseudomonadota bacterium]|jgi:nitroreductase
MQNLIDLILQAYNWRHACKEFDNNKKIADTDMSFLYEVIRLSPSSFGLQPYEVFVLNNHDLLTKLHPHMWGAQKQLFSASHVLMFVTKKDVSVRDDYYQHIVADIQQTPAELLELRKNLIDQHQIDVIKVNENQRYLTDWATKQAYIALGNLMTAAAQIGIDSCPIEGFIPEPIHQILEQQQIIDLTKYEVSVFCCLGYRLNQPRAKTRKPINELIHQIN